MCNCNYGWCYGCGFGIDLYEFCEVMKGVFCEGEDVDVREREGNLVNGVWNGV